MGYTDQEGIAIESNYKRLNFRANVESKVFNRITVGVNLAPSASWNEGGRVDGKDRQATNVLTMAPVAEPEDGIYTGAGGLRLLSLDQFQQNQSCCLYGTCTKQRRKGAIQFICLY